MDLGPTKIKSEITAQLEADLQLSIKVVCPNFFNQRNK